jgi:hypothetical protein
VCPVLPLPLSALLKSSKDSFYKRHTQEEIDLANASLFDFDHPDALDMDLFAQVGDDVTLDSNPTDVLCSVSLILRHASSPTYLSIRSQTISALTRLNTCMELRSSLVSLFLDKRYNNP